VKTESGFLILRLVDHRAARARALEELRADIEEHLLRVKREEIVMGWLAEQEKRAKIQLATK
jgi:hypothetical protein